MPTALLICMENTFWSISEDGDFEKSFEKSFTTYVESGTRKKVEAEIHNLGHPGGRREAGADEYKERFFKIIIEHNLRKFIVSICNQHI